MREMIEMIRTTQRRLGVHVVLFGLVVGTLLSWTAREASAVCGMTSDHIGDDTSEVFTDTVDSSRTILMHGGADHVEAGNCRDDVYGQEGSDELHGAYGNDFVSGGAGSDSSGLFGGADDDTIEGNNGYDLLTDAVAGNDTDVLRGGTEDDNLFSSDGDGRDTVNGEGGADSCEFADSGDTLISCMP